MSTLSRRPPLAVLAAPLLLSLAIIGCPTAERTEEGSSSSSGAAAPPSAAPSATVAAPPATVAPPPGPVSPPVLVGRSGSDAGAPADAGAIVDAGKPATADAGASGKLKACFDKCQGVLQTCITSGLPKDGGLPQPLNAAACQTAFTTCQSACAP